MLNSYNLNLIFMKCSFICILAILSYNFSYSQKCDTLQSDVGKEGGFRMIRIWTPNKKISKAWITNWKKNGIIERSFSQYNNKNQKIIDIDSVFSSNNKLIEYKRVIGETIENDHQYFDENGILERRDISIYVKGKYIIFQKFLDNQWSYRCIIDGEIPDYVEINKERFDEAVKIYNDKLLFNKLDN